MVKHLPSPAGGSAARPGPAPAWFSPFRLLSPGGAGGRLSIFIFHRVLHQHDPLLPYEPTVAQFDWMVGLIARHFQVLPLGQAVHGLANGGLPRAAAVITFDDGYADNHDLALPVLQRHGATASFFIATRYIDGGRMWNDSVTEAVRLLPAGELDWSDLGLPRTELTTDLVQRFEVCKTWLEKLKYLTPQERDRRTDEIARRAGLAERSELMMTRQQVCAMANSGMTVGGHTQGHPILTTVSDAELRDEIGGGREVLAAWLGQAPTLFAYPDGIPVVDYGQREMDLLRAVGYVAAVSTANGAARAGDDLMQLPRFTPWDRTAPRFGLRCALNLLRREPYLRVGGGSGPAGYTT